MLLKIIIPILLLNLECVIPLDPVTVELLTPSRRYGEACGYESCPLTVDNMINVHIVPSTHYELALTRTFSQHYTGDDDIFARTDINMKRTLDFVITELWADKARKFSLAESPYFFHWWSQRDATVRRMVYELIRQGWLHLIGGGWGMSDEATTSYHAIIDHFTYSLRKINSTLLECGRPLVAWQADVMGHSREFASLMAQMGFDGLFVNPISYEDELTRMRRQGMEFLWRGSDDLGSESDIFTHKLFDGYWSPPGFCFSSMCNDPLIVTSDTMVNNAEERAGVFLDQAQFRQAPYYNTSHIMVMMGQLDGYFDATVWFNNIDKLINFSNEKARQMHKRIYVLYSTPACYLRAVRKSSPMLETKQDDFFPYSYDKTSYMAGMYTSRPSVKLLAREGLLYMQMAKQLQVLAKLFQNSKFFEDFNWILGAFQDHTVITGAMRDYVKGYYVRKMYIAVQKSTLLFKQSFNKLRGSPIGTMYYRCSFNISSCGTADLSSYLIFIYNPLAWPVTVPVRLPTLKVDTTVYDPKGNIIKSKIMKIPEPIQQIPNRHGPADHEIVFLAQDVPPLGYRSYYIEKTRLERTKRSIIKKIKKRKNKKYLTRQTNPLITDENVRLDKLSDLNAEYEYFDDDNNSTVDDMFGKDEATDVDDMLLSTDKSKIDISENKVEQHLTPNRVSTIIFGNVSGSRDTDQFKVVTPQAIRSNFFDRLIDEKEMVQPLRETTIMFGNVSDSRGADQSEVVTPQAKPESKFMDRFITDKETNTIRDYTFRNSGQMSFTNDTTETNESMNVKVKESEDTVKNIDVSNEEIFVYKPTRPGSKIYVQPESTTHTYVKPTKTSRNEIANALVANMDATSKGENQESTTEEFKHVPTLRSSGKIYIWSTPPIFVDMPTMKSGGKIYLQSPPTTEENVEETEKEIARRRMAYVDPVDISVLYIENQYIRVNLDPSTRKVTSVDLANGLSMSLDIQFYYYVSDEPQNVEGRENRKNPGVYVFRSIDNIPVPILDYVDAKIYKNQVVEELHSRYSDHISFVLRLYRDSPVIEMDWLVGAMPYTDQLGKDIFVRYLTDLNNAGAFYTDSNGRQTIKRMRNLRPMFERGNTDPVAGNYYPVTSKIYIQDKIKNIRLSVLNDRAQGGASLYDGEIDLMVNRFIMTDDTGLTCFINETVDGLSVPVRGKHYLYMSKADHKQNRIFEKKLAKEIELMPQTFVSKNRPYGKDSKNIWFAQRNEFSFLKHRLPLGIHILTLEQWNDDTILLRLENYLEKSDCVKTGIKTVHIRELFVNLEIKTVKETTLAANIWLSDFIQLEWNKKDNFVKNFNKFYASGLHPEFDEEGIGRDYEEVDLSKGIVLKPQQIRTFVCWFNYVDYKIPL